MQGLTWVCSTVLLKYVLSTILGASDDVSPGNCNWELLYKGIYLLFTWILKIRPLREEVADYGLYILSCQWTRHWTIQKRAVLERTKDGCYTAITFSKSNMTTPLHIPAESISWCTVFILHSLCASPLKGTDVGLDIPRKYTGLWQIWLDNNVVHWFFKIIYSLMGSYCIKRRLFCLSFSACSNFEVQSKSKLFKIRNIVICCCLFSGSH